MDDLSTRILKIIDQLLKIIDQLHDVDGKIILALEKFKEVLSSQEKSISYLQKVNEELLVRIRRIEEPLDH